MKNAQATAPQSISSDRRPVYDVLVVEDDGVMREQLALALTDEGFTVTTARDGREALDAVRQNSVSLVVLDLMLPVISGREVAQALKADPMLSEIPVVMVTAVTNVHLAPPGPVYLKPIHRDSFVRAVRLHLRRGPLRTGSA